MRAEVVKEKETKTWSKTCPIQTRYYSFFLMPLNTLKVNILIKERNEMFKMR